VRKNPPIFEKRGGRWRVKDRRRFTLWALAAVLIVGFYFLYDLPDLDKVKPLDTRPSITVMANDGTLIARYGGMQGNLLGIKDFPPNLIAAVLSVEDRRFYSHFGIDPLGLARAMVRNILAGRWVQGGSTITQQLAKNLFLTPDKTIRRKVQEALMALKIEHNFTKDEILTAYLNRVYFGSGAYGVDAASKTYFNKPVRELDLWESAVLAGLLKAPSRFSPASNPELARQRAEVVIETMKDAGYLDAKTTAQEIKKAKLIKIATMAGDFNRYFSDWVIDQIDSFIATTDGDIVVKTTLDPKLQALAEEKRKDLFKKLTPKDKLSQAALVTEDRDGAILAMIGGVDYKVSQFNRATQARRQPGSAFKPFVYLAAIENGFPPDSMIEDAPITEGDYRPNNYDEKYFGTVTLTEALAKSLNTATIRLLQEIGVGKLMDVTARMGFAGELKPELATGLGTEEVTLLELTNAYSIIANGGSTVWPYAVLSIKDSHGQLLYQHDMDTDHPRVFSSRDIGMLDGMLVQAVAEGTGTAAQLPHGHVAGKTGTTQNYRDAWFVGYTDRLITGVWMGNDDATPMNRVTGGRFPAQLWHDYMNGAIDIEVPEFVPESFSFGGGQFSGMLERWSSSLPVNTDTSPPVYNK
jgi:penicillin-binding protein 1A